MSERKSEHTVGLQMIVTLDKGWAGSIFWP